MDAIPAHQLARPPASHVSRRDITRSSTIAFIAKVLERLDKQNTLSLEELARAKYRIVEALMAGIADLRENWQASAYQRALIPQSRLELATNSELELVFDEQRCWPVWQNRPAPEQTYSYNQPYGAGMRFGKHLFRVIGDLAGKGDEYEYAVHIDRMPETRAWVRNTSRQPYSFWLQTPSDRFYPDFIVLLNDGRYLVVEFKGEPYITNDDSKEKKLVGDL